MSVDSNQAVLDRALEGRVNATDIASSPEFQEKYQGIWTHGKQYEKDKDAYFFGVNATKAHLNAHKYVLDPIGHAVSETVEGTRRYVVAPVSNVIGDTLAATHKYVLKPVGRAISYSLDATIGQAYRAACGFVRSSGGKAPFIVSACLGLGLYFTLMSAERTLPETITVEEGKQKRSFMERAKRKAGKYYIMGLDKVKEFAGSDDSTK